MAMRVAGKLNYSDGERPSFEGCRIEALFAPTSSSGSPSALSDAAGNFALALDDRQEIASDTVRFVAFSPTGEVIGEAEITTADLGDAITIDVEYLANAPLAPGTPTATPERTAVDAMFRGETGIPRRPHRQPQAASRGVGRDRKAHRHRLRAVPSDAALARGARRAPLRRARH